MPLSVRSCHQKTVVWFVLSRLDYCNLLVVGCPKYLLSKLQKVCNNTARLIFRTNRSTHITPMLYSLHWLPIEQRIKCKLSFLCFKIISHQSPMYLWELLHLHLSQQLCSIVNSECSEYHPSKQSPMVSALSLTRLLLSGTSSLFLSVIYLCQFFQIFLENLSLFKNLFFTLPYVCVYVCAHAHVLNCENLHI